MAEAVVSFTVERLGDLIIAEAKFLSGVKAQVEDAQSKLQWMRCFLKDADVHVRDGDERVRLWVVQIRESAFALEDVIETFILKVDSRRATGGFKGVLRRIACGLYEGIELHRVGSDIDRISANVAGLTTALQTYGIRALPINEGASSSNQRLRGELRRAYSHVVEEDVVGFDQSTDELVSHLTKSGNSAYRVVSICGMGGLGKTTLARKVYHHIEVRRYFDSLAWASISQQCEIRDVWEGVLISLTSPTAAKREEIARKRDAEIAKELYNVQKQRKCLVVLDDIWTASTWDRLKVAFPENGTDSKILLTTRKVNVASHVDKHGLLYQPRCLNESESWELFHKKSFFGVNATNSEADKENMKELGREMLEHCAGLPLAIIVLSGLLSIKRTVDEWAVVNKNVETYLSRGNEHSEQEYQGVSSVLGLSYNDLPYYLKPCFLYLARYPEDFGIKVKELCLTLIAEDFVSVNHQRRYSTETTEDIAYESLSELVERNMIRVEKWGSSGRMKILQIHDLMRDFCLYKAQEEDFLQFVDLRNGHKALESVSIGAITNVVPRNKVRRVAIYANHDVDDLLPFIDNRDGSLRSLVYINREFETTERVMKPLFERFQMLRILNLDNESMPTFFVKLPKEIGKLIHLRLLSLWNCKVEMIPSSIGNLRCLQTLKLRAYTIPVTVPNVMWKLEQLRHLYLPRITSLEDTYLRLTNVSNLQTLAGIATKYLDVKDFLQLTNLKKLGIFVDKNLGRIYHSSTGVKFNCLQSLAVRKYYGDMVDIVPVISCYPLIYKLNLSTPITKLPEVHEFSLNLMKLSLFETRLKDDPMRTLEKLPNLKVVSIKYNSFTGNEMVCSRGGFPRLDILEFHSLYLKQWRIEKGALPSLRRLEIYNCLKWSTLPDGLIFVTALKEVEINSMPSTFKMRFKEGGEDFYKVQHVPSLVFLNTLEYLDTDTESEDGS